LTISSSDKPVSSTAQASLAAFSGLSLTWFSYWWFSEDLGGSDLIGVQFVDG
jgi:hypothetical protein